MSATVSQSNPAQADLVTLTIDGVEVRVPKGTLVVEAAKTIHTDIPVYCYHEKLGPAGLCRICLVEIEGMPKLQIACNTPVADGMKVYTQNPRVDDGRRAILEFFLLNHPLDCPICDKGGECDLQDYAMAWGQGSSRMIEPKTAEAEGRRSRADDRARRRALHRLPALRALRRHHHARGLAAHRRPRRAHDHRDRDGQAVRLRLHRATSPSCARSARSRRRRTGSARGRGTTTARRPRARSAASAARCTSTSAATRCCAR